MRRYPIVTFLLIFLSCHALAAQPDAAGLMLERVARELDRSLKGWEFATGDGAWRSYTIGLGVDSAEMRFRASIPVRQVYAGMKVLHTPVVMRLKLRAVGRCVVTPVLGGGQLEPFAVDGGDGGGREETREILLTRDAVGKQLAFELRVANHGFRPPRGESWPPRLRPLAEEGLSFSISSAETDYPAASESRSAAESWLASMRVADRLIHPELVRRTFIGGSYEIPDHRRIPPDRLADLKGAFTRAVLAFNLAALLNGRPDDMQASIRRSNAEAAELARYAREFKIYLIGNAHIDIAWLWRMAETERVARNTYRTVIENMMEYPELRYAQSQAVTYDWIERDYPELFQQIRQRVKEGRWEIVGGMWVEPDCNLISGESWIRQILYGKRYFREKFGIDVRTGWNPDSFGYNWNMPQIYRKSGIDRFITQKIRWNDTTVFPYFIFWWQGADDSRLLTYFPPLSYESRVQLDEVARAAGTYEAVTGYKKSLVLYGIGDHGGGPNREILDRVRGYGEMGIAPDFIHAPAGEFLDQIPADLGDGIPTWADELYLEYHRGTYTTQAETKRNNRRCEAMLSTAEKILSINALLGDSYPRTEMEGTWKQVLTNQFHDILPGSSIAPVYRDAAQAYADARSRLSQQIQGGLAALARRVDTKAIAGKPLLVFNPLSWTRSDFLSVHLDGEWKDGARVLDAAGRELPAEVAADPSGRLALSFVAEAVPGLGWRSYYIQPGRATINPAGLSADGRTLENERHRLTVDAATGDIVSLVDKTTARDFVAPGRQLNRLELWEDRPENWDAWNIGYTGRMWSLGKADSVAEARRTPVRATILVKKSFLGYTKERYSPTEDFPSSSFTQEITLYHNLDRIDIHVTADWWEDHLLLKAAFPVSVSADTASYEIPFAAIRRSTRKVTLAEKAKFEVPALRWADLSDGQGGISLLNDCKYGHDIQDGVIRLSLLRAPTWPDPMADRGRHEFTYSLYTHSGSWDDAETVRRGAELNTPLQAVLTDPHPGDLPSAGGLFQVDGEGIILDTLKPAEDGEGFILRLYESKGRSARATLTLHAEPARVIETDLMEDPGVSLPYSGKSIPLTFGKFEVKTLRVTFRR